MVLDGGPSVYDAMVMVQVIVPFLHFLQENADLIIMEMQAPHNRKELPLCAGWKA